MPRLLLVEDNEMNRDMLSRRLQRKGFEVALATDGHQGLDLARAQPPDLIPLDMSLPVAARWAGPAAGARPAGAGADRPAARARPPGGRPAPRPERTGCRGSGPAGAAGLGGARDRRRLAGTGRATAAPTLPARPAAPCHR